MKLLFVLVGFLLPVEVLLRGMVEESKSCNSRLVVVIFHGNLLYLNVAVVDVWIEVDNILIRSHIQGKIIALNDCCPFDSAIYKLYTEPRRMSSSACRLSKFLCIQGRLLFFNSRSFTRFN